MKQKSFFLSMLFLALSFSIQGQVHPKREFRGAWLHTVSGGYKGMSTEEMKWTLVQQLDGLKEAGINAVIFQVRPEADALYLSTLEPWSRYLTGVQGQAPSPMWDPMSFMIYECHKRGMEFHAWINPYRVKTNNNNELAANHLYFRNPEIFVTYGKQTYFDPGRPESRKHIGNVVRDIVNRYDVDAIHMDDYFYPYPVEGEDFPDNLSFAAYGRGFDNKNDWRRENVNILIKEIHEILRETKPWVKFGVSPFGIYRNKKNDPRGSETNGLQNYDELYADILLWIEKGWIDYNVPQLYWEIGHPAADYEILTKWWAENASGRPLFIGQSVMRTVDKEDLQNPSVNQVARKMELQRAYPTIGGSCMWPGGAILSNPKGFKDELANNYHKYPALQPTYPFIDDKAPKNVRKMKPMWTEDGLILFWTVPKAKNEMDEAKQYVVYRFEDKEKENLDDPSKIVAITQHTFYKLPYQDGKTKCRYVVTALDRLQNESKPQSKKIKL